MTTLGNDCVLGTGGYGNVFFLSTNAMGSSGSAAWKAYKKGAYFANPCYTQIHPTCIPVHGDQQSKLTLMSESLRNDGRVWVPRTKEMAQKVREGKLKPEQIKEEDRYYYLEERYPSFGNLVPRDVASRKAKMVCDVGLGVESSGLAVYLDFAEAIERLGEDTVLHRYGNLFHMYEKITAENPYKTPITNHDSLHNGRIGLTINMSNIEGFVVVRRNSPITAQTAGALRDEGWPTAISSLTPWRYSLRMPPKATVDRTKSRFQQFRKGSGTIENCFDQTASTVLTSTGVGHIMWTCRLARNEKSLQEALTEIPKLREEFWKNVKVFGRNEEFNQNLENAYRLADFLELGELLAYDAWHRKESCGGHFREESQTEEGEALRKDDEFSYVAAWEYKGVDQNPVLHKEPLVFENVHLTQRSYK